MVIRALVQARLLGLKLLTLDACVVVSGNNPGAPTPYPLSNTGLDVNDRSAMSTVMSPGPETSLAYAMRLLEQGIHTLEDSRRLHLSGAGLAGREQDGLSCVKDLGQFLGLLVMQRLLRPGIG
jgi:hypothetical protein